MDEKDEAREFLASRRARLTPADVGLPPSIGRRRVAGLRRDEVAMLAGMSSEYYAQLERGNLAGASEPVLDALARALRLDEAELLHLRNLAQAAKTPRRRRRPAQSEAPRIRPSVQRVLDALHTVPAHVTDSRSDIVAWNALSRELLSPIHAFASATGSAPNPARFAFLDPSAQHFFPDWEKVIRDLVAALNISVGRDPYNRPLTDLIGELSSRSETFRSLWAHHDVAFHRTGVKRMRHPDVGLLELDFEVMLLPGEPGFSVASFSAAPGTPSADNLALLASLAASRAAEQSNSLT